MFNARLFLRNHSANYKWTDLPEEIRGLFSSPDGSLVWAEFFDADREHGQYYFEFVRAGGSKPRRLRASIVMFQETCGLLTLIERPFKRGHRLQCICLDASSIESAVFKPRRGMRK